jgi:hypothetical protein
MAGSASPESREELTLYDFQRTLLDDYDLTKAEEYDAATELIADYNAKTELYTITNKEVVARLKKNKINDSEMRDFVRRLQGAIFTTWQMQDGRKFQSEYTQKKTWRAALDEFRKSASIPSMETYQILHDGNQVSNKGPPHWGPGNFDFDVMCKQDGGKFQRLCPEHFALPGNSGLC